VCQTAKSDAALPDQMRCPRYLVEKGCPIHPGTLISAALRGEADCVRYLHERGVGLWEHAWEAGRERHRRPSVEHRRHRGLKDLCVAKKILPVCWAPKRPNRMWAAVRYVHGAVRYKRGVGRGAVRTRYVQPHVRCGTVHTTACAARCGTYNRMWAAVRYVRGAVRYVYGAYMGAPFTPVVHEVFRFKRIATRAVLLCFHVAGRLSRETQTGRKRAAWAGMGRMPPELIEKVLVDADLEIPESIGRGLPVQSSVRVHVEQYCLNRVAIYGHPSSPGVLQ
jgi:hypothetical protein